MTINQAIEILMDIEDKNMTIMIPTDMGFHAACVAESGIAKDDNGNDLFAFQPCFCYLENVDEGIEIEVRANDFEAASKN
jgi:hypothetical protein